MFRATLPSIFNTSHKMPRLPRNLHLVTNGAALTMRFAQNEPQDTSKVLRLPRKMKMDTSQVLRLPRKKQRIFWKRRKSIAPATQNHFRQVTKHVWISRSATPATQNEAPRRWKPPKVTPVAELTIGLAIRPWHGHLQTVADGCEWLHTQRQANTPSTPRPPEWNGNPCYAFGNKHICHMPENRHISTYICLQLHRQANTPSTPRPPEWNGNPCYAFGNKHICHMPENRHISTYICLQQYDSSACEFCVCSVFSNSRPQCGDQKNTVKHHQQRLYTRHAWNTVCEVCMSWAQPTSFQLWWK